MPSSYGRDLDLNLLRVFAVVAEVGSVTEAAKRLYLTQPAVSAALRRLTTAVGAPLFVRSGRGLVLTSRGERLRGGIESHLQALVDAALAAPVFDPSTSERTLRLGLSDSAELWLLPRLLQVLAGEAPRMRVVAIPVQFRTVGAALAAGLDAAVTVADELPGTIRRERLITGSFTCLYDPRHARLRKPLSEREYFAREHIIVSYNGDLRGVVEDAFGKTRNIRCSVSSFANLGALIDGTAMLATIPAMVAAQIRKVRPHLRTTPLPFAFPAAWFEMLWPVASDDDPPCRFVRAHIQQIARTLAAKGMMAPK
ncbi:LysR family transcriptional regulator [Nannocystis radixulma]|uniref:LysR family transcriptional regulator n=1 Tax=Nannocystis radixulma TaxID=2995305 RepID=A0ABT5BF52_9BACT|nr:LysR family transcriptional regulator [Nannocystis radixulma]MDC0672774.1 LysR family transcriptional regulator [Nannocystis radixulma]